MCCHSVRISCKLSLQVPPQDHLSIRFVCRVRLESPEDRTGREVSQSMSVKHLRIESDEDTRHRR